MLRHRILWVVSLLVFILSSLPNLSLSAQECRPAPATSNVIERDGVYAAYANGIVRDTKTGLEWKAGPDKDSNWNEARSWIQNLNLDGGGWRLPTMDELEGLYRRGAGEHNMTPLLKTSGDFVWSVETEDSHGGVWFFEFFNGDRDWLYPDSRRFFSPGDRRSYSGRAFAARSQQDSQNQKAEVAIAAEKPSHSRPSSTARGNERDGIYAAYSNGIVRDTKTGLEWKAGPDKDTNWNEARSWIQNLNLDGGGWRMPTMDELEGLYRRGAGDRNMTPLLKTSGDFVWSVETEDSHGGVWFFEFFNGYRDWLYPDSRRFFSPAIVVPTADGLLLYVPGTMDNCLN